jgi:hypothetical protein
MRQAVLLLGLLPADAMIPCMLFLAFLAWPILANAAVLWDQSAHDSAGKPVVDQELPDLPSYSLYQVNDFTTDPGGWVIERVSTYFTRGSGNWEGISQARLNVFPKTGKVPDVKYRPQDGALVDISLTSLEADVWQVTASGWAWRCRPRARSGSG